MGDSKLSVLLSTTGRLLDQFIASLNSLPPNSTTPPPESPSPLPLLSTCAATLRAQTTKLSLLIITPPFTSSAICTILSSIDEAILPTLLTAILLITPSDFTKAYSTEAISLAKATFRDLKALVYLAEARSKDGRPSAEPTPSQKSAVTEATGKIWEDCDELKHLADNGIAGFTVKKAEQYLELIKDAVKEIEDWDPEEDDDDDDDEDDDEDGIVAEESQTTPDLHHQDNEPGQIANEKIQQTPRLQQEPLQILIRIPQSLDVVIHQRLKKGLPPDPTPAQRFILDQILTNLEQISTCLDDVAERLYLWDTIGAMLTMEKARRLVVEIVKSVLDGWDSAPPSKSASTAAAATAVAVGQEDGTSQPGDGGEPRSAHGPTADAEPSTKTHPTKEDRYVRRALEWIESVGMPTALLSGSSSTERRDGSSTNHNTRT